MIWRTNIRRFGPSKAEVTALQTIRRWLIRPAPNRADTYRLALMRAHSCGAWLAGHFEMLASIRDLGPVDAKN